MDKDQEFKVVQRQKYLTLQYQTNINSNFNILALNQMESQDISNQSNGHQLEKQQGQKLFNQTHENQHLSSNVSTNCCQKIFNKSILQAERHGLNLQKFEMCFESMESSLIRVIYRKFHNKLITFYIQSLKNEQMKLRKTKQMQIKVLKQQNWAFKQLFYKKFHTKNDLIMLQFINMCAEKIQSYFKGYLTRKRHRQAFSKIITIKNKLSALLIGWKTWNVYNSKKIKSIRNAAQTIQKQIDWQIQNSNLDKFKKTKKIQYFNSSLQVVKENFSESFHNLYYQGAWIYEIQSRFAMPKKSMKKNFAPQQYILLQQEDQKPTQPVIQQKKIPRNREFRAISSKQIQNSISLNRFQNQYQSKKIELSNKSIASTNFQSIQPEERPIVAKGKYELTEEDIKNTENQFLKRNQSSINMADSSRELQNSPSSTKNKLKEDEKKKLIKRQKYDPRKAIEQQKKRLEQEKKKKADLEKTQQSKPCKESNSALKKNSNLNKKVEKKNRETFQKTSRKGRLQQRKEKQIEKDSSKQKTVEKGKKQYNLLKKGDNSKSIKLIANHKKVQSKVNCWGPKRDLSQKNIYLNSQDFSYHSKYLISLKQKNDSKVETQNSKIQDQKGQQTSMDEEINYSNFGDRPKMTSQQQQRKSSKGDQDKVFESSYLKKFAEQKRTPRISEQKKQVYKIQEKESQLLACRFQQLNKNIKRLSQSSNLKSMRQARNVNHQNSQTSLQKKKEEIHRTIEQLEEVYQTLYSDRLNNLKTKLSMLESTRFIQRDDSIPILLEDSKFVKQMYSKHTFSRLYWPQVRTMQTNYLDYIKFNGF